MVRQSPQLIMTAHSITCPKCEGKGQVGIGDHLEKTLACFSRGGAKTAEDIAQRLNINATTASNRLADLYLLELVSRERRGKYWFYSRA